MSADWHSWLLVPERNNPVLENIAKRLQAAFEADLTDRPAVALGVRDGQAVLWTDSPRKLLDLLEKRRSLVAFSLAPATELRRLDGCVFHEEARWVEVKTWIAAGWASATPHYRRVVELKWFETQLQEDLDRRHADVKSGPREAKIAALLLNPPQIRQDRGRFAPIFDQQAAALVALTDGALLPPTQTPPEGSYFLEDLRALRAAVASAAGIGEPRLEEPAAVALWRMTDEPLLRDLLMEGGGLSVTGGPGEPTTVRLEVHGLAERDPIAAYRAQGVLGPIELPGSELSRRLAEVIRNDIRTDITWGLAIEAAREAVDWTVEALPIAEARPEGHSEGTWQRLLAIKDRVDEDNQRRKFDEEITVPSRGRLTGDPARPYSNPDHDLAERRFMCVAWRCPWSAGQVESWRYAMVALLPTELLGKRTSPAERVGSWRAEWRGEGRFEYRESPGRSSEVVHPATATPDEVLQWRLLMPLGTVFTPRATLRLDDCLSRLDHGYAVA